MSRPAILVDNLSKSYRIGRTADPHASFRDALVGAIASPFRRLKRLGGGGDTSGDQTFWALKDISFEVQPGEVVGVIGRNGAGKSTLLKILSRIAEPTSGSARIRGRLASLLEVGTGFHPELTGRENIFLNGAILGMRKAEIHRKFDDIVSFADVEAFLDTPVKRYSSGMYVRLAFSVAAHLEPEILIIDEVLAVGDMAFQKKCLGKMQEVSHAGRTVLFVSHNMSAVNELCSRAIRIHQGCVAGDGPPREMIEQYLAAAGADVEGTDLANRRECIGTGRMRVDRVRILCDGVESRFLQHGRTATFELYYRGASEIRPKSVRFCIVIQSRGGAKFMGIDGATTNFTADCLPRDGILKCHINKLTLTSGSYHALIAINVDSIEVDRIEDAFEFEVISDRFPIGTHVSVDHDWSVGVSESQLTSRLIG